MEDELDLARVLNTLSATYLELDDDQRQTLLDDLMQVLSGAFTRPVASGPPAGRPKRTVRSVLCPCCSQRLRLELRC